MAGGRFIAPLSVSGEVSGGHARHVGYAVIFAAWLNLAAQHVTGGVTLSQLRALSRPTRLQIGHVDYRVKWSNKKIATIDSQTGKEHAGLGLGHRQLILMRTDLGPDYEAETLLHEVMHQCLQVAGVELDADAAAGCDDVEERAVRTLAGTLLATLRANPDLAEYLQLRGDGNAA